MKYIEALREGERIQEIYLCKQKNVAMTKTGKEYENVILQDKTGSLDAKIWDPRSMGIDDFDALDYVEVSGDVTVFNGQTQLSIKRARKAKEGEYDPSDYLPVSDKNLDDMFNELLGFISKVENTYYKQLLSKLFIENQEFAKAFKNHSAAKSVHHGFIGGLLEHTVSVTRLCEFYTKQYPMLNKDLLITAAICHDIGKVYELSSFPLSDYTDVGQLEYGSPKKPALVEAMALNFADNTDAKMETMAELFKANANKSSDEWLGYNRLLETNIRKTSE